MFYDKNLFLFVSGEDIVDAVQREVQEETNIRTEFVSVISFRHTLKSNFGCSDIYFVVELKPLNFDIKKEDEEIEASQWMDVSKFYIKSCFIVRLCRVTDQMGSVM